jgi:hypothetical protein
MRAMGPFPEQRFRSLRELRAALERLANPPSTEAPLPESAPMVRRRPQQEPPPMPADLAIAPRNVATATEPSNSRDEASRLPMGPPPPQMLPPSAQSSSPAAVSYAPPPPLAPARKAEPVAVPTPAEPSSIKSAERVTAHSDYESIEVLRSATLKRVAYLVSGALVAFLIAYFALRTKPWRFPRPVATSTPRSAEPPRAAPFKPAPTTFDLEIAGLNAAKKLHDCFQPQRAVAETIMFGAGILWNKGAALSARVFLAPPSDDPLSSDERRCVAHALVGVSGGAAPNKSVMVDYTFRLRSTGNIDVKGVPQK